MRTNGLVVLLSGMCSLNSKTAVRSQLIKLASVNNCVQDIASHNATMKFDNINQLFSQKITCVYRNVSYTYQHIILTI